MITNKKERGFKIEKTNKMEAIKKVAWEIIEMTEGVSVFVGAESFKKTTLICGKI